MNLQLEEIKIRAEIANLVVETNKAQAEALAHFPPPINIVMAAVINRHGQVQLDEIKLKWERILASAEREKK